MPQPNGLLGVWGTRCSVPLPGLIAIGEGAVSVWVVMAVVLSARVTLSVDLRPGGAQSVDGGASDESSLPGEYSYCSVSKLPAF